MLTGQEQAKYLGQRLANSGLKFDSIVMSTMTRAEETAKLILKELSVASRSSDLLLEEGAPFPPEPPSKHWRPKQKVITDLKRNLKSIYTVETHGNRLDAIGLAESIFISHLTFFHLHSLMKNFELLSKLMKVVTLELVNCDTVNGIMQLFDCFN